MKRVRRLRVSFSPPVKRATRATARSTLNFACAGGEFVFVRGDFHGNDDIALDFDDLAHCLISAGIAASNIGRISLGFGGTIVERVEARRVASAVMPAIGWAGWRRDRRRGLRRKQKATARTRLDL